MAWKAPWISIVCIVALAAIPTTRADYVLVGVSGGLQDGFPDHSKMDYVTSSDGTDGTDKEEHVPAILMGRGLVRGTKAYLDVMQPGWRQYVAEPHQPLINSNVIVSGCHEHANQYWIYAVDARQFLVILNNEPRFLSITPDTALVDLESNETDPLVKQLAWSEIQRQDKTDKNKVAIPIVVSVWFHAASYIPSPPIRVHDDGTQVTNFPESLALWANVNDMDRVAGNEPHDTTCRQDTTCPNSNELHESRERYWQGIRHAVRQAEKQVDMRLQQSRSGPPFACQKEAPLGVGPETARINHQFTKTQLSDILTAAGYYVDFDQGIVSAKS